MIKEAHMRKRLKKKVVHKTIQAWINRGLTPRKVSASWCWKTFGYNRGILRVLQATRNYRGAYRIPIHVDFAADTIEDYTRVCIAHLDVCMSTGLPMAICTQAENLAKQLCEDRVIEKEVPQNQHYFEGWPPPGD